MCAVNTLSVFDVVYLSDGHANHARLPPPPGTGGPELGAQLASGDGLADRKRLLMQNCDAVVALPGQ